MPQPDGSASSSPCPPRQRTFEGVRIGEFPKELDLTEGRATGIPKILKVMAADGSPAPVFESDDERTSFVIRLPVHAVSQPM